MKPDRVIQTRDHQRAQFTDPTVALEMTRDRLHEAMRHFPMLLVTLYEMATRRHAETTELTSSEGLPDAAEEIEVDVADLEEWTLV